MTTTTASLTSKLGADKPLTGGVQVIAKAETLRHRPRLVGSSWLVQETEGSSKRLVEFRKRPPRDGLSVPAAECPLLTQSRHDLVHCTCAFGGKADMPFCAAYVRL